MTITPTPRQRRHRRITAARRKVFLEHLEGGWSIAAAAEAAGVPRRQSWYEHRKADKKFAAEWDGAVECGTDVLEDELRRRGLEGYDEETFDGDGRLVRRVHRFSDNALIAQLKARRPELYRDGKVEVTGALDSVITFDLPPAKLAEAAEILAKARDELVEAIDFEEVRELPETTSNGEAS